MRESAMPRAVVEPTVYMADGISVDRYQSQEPNESSKTLVLVHGGTQASWAWEQMAPFLAQAGHDVHALNWSGRGGSANVTDEALLRLSIRDVVRDIHKVTSRLDKVPTLIGHSMGAMACQLYAAEHRVQALVLLAPVVPKEASPHPVEVLIDLDCLWSPPSREVAFEMFFDGLTLEDQQRYQLRIVPESPLRCYEATRFTLSVNIERIGVPAMIVSGNDDPLTPAETGKALARLYNAAFSILPGVGHNMMLGERAAQVSNIVLPWLRTVAG
ncbi:alpha/beta hydrolase (plasmid) [Agrobacterium tumefaciens]|uniref:Alpha/beta hydrolase n=1 Tax=Agrobacterium tumefaciens TaxID=358 RepID=A0AAJ4N8N0_AGRTU|nr:alpha/beta hydrolase [Agrobacterium tumefaciens]